MQKNELLKKITDIFKSDIQLFGKGKFYQSYEPLGIDGVRKTENRFNIYKLNKYILPIYGVLDIGCNCGFFSLYVSQYCKEVDAIDNNKNLIEIGKMVCSFLCLPVSFFCSDIINFNFDKRYDFIIMAAVHGWIKLSAEEIVVKVSNLLNNGGKILLESHRILRNKKKYKDDKYCKITSFLSNNFEMIYKGNIKDDGIIKRKFSIWQKLNRNK